MSFFQLIITLLTPLVVTLRACFRFRFSSCVKLSYFLQEYRSEVSTWSDLDKVLAQYRQSPADNLSTTEKLDIQGLGRAIVWTLHKLSPKQNNSLTWDIFYSLYTILSKETSNVVMRMIGQSFNFSQRPRLPEPALEYDVLMLQFLQHFSSKGNYLDALLRDELRVRCLNSSAGLVKSNMDLAGYLQQLFIVRASHLRYRCKSFETTLEVILQDLMAMNTQGTIRRSCRLFISNLIQLLEYAPEVTSQNARLYYDIQMLAMVVLEQFDQETTQAIESSRFQPVLMIQMQFFSFLHTYPGHTPVLKRIEVWQNNVSEVLEMSSPVPLASRIVALVMKAFVQKMHQW
ncbi:hypothetical protein AMATHDRAFT_49153 [Amanita thiersii Skay4041]|uniref:Uncharacterized protein n=1 Tax=Amanita thiersii Skay4041 TaxID=703135 RepID=A0A2A9NCW8_9AGAR|nr:hypothetical protein AMATHDRAFT_49153 [Amanita thiersii Skay4041]